MSPGAWMSVHRACTVHLRKRTYHATTQQILRQDYSLQHISLHYLATCTHIYVSMLPSSIIKIDTQHLIRNLAVIKVVAQHPRSRLSCYGSCSFAVCSPTAWNSLPAAVRNFSSSSSSSCFCSHLKTELFLHGIWR